MAQLKDTVVQGTLSATDALISTSVQTSILRVPSSSNSTTYGPGTNGQILRSNGTKAYWGTLAATDIPDVYIKKAGNNDGIMTGTLTLHGLKGTADIDYGTTLPTSPTTGQIFFQISDPWYELPPVNSSDNGKILTVVGGQWTAVTKQNELPSVSSSDNGKVLSVVNGVWTSSNSLTTLSNNLGNLSNLTTTTKSSAVAAINEINTNVTSITVPTITPATSTITDFGHNSFIKNGIMHIRGYFKAGALSDQTIMFTLSGVTALKRSEGIMITKVRDDVHPIYIAEGTNQIKINSYYTASDNWSFIIIDILIN